MGPAAMISMIRRLRATADRYLARRGLARPAVPWAQYLAVEKGHTRVR
jgi:hypothetical protein